MSKLNVIAIIALMLSSAFSSAEVYRPIAWNGLNSVAYYTDTNGDITIRWSRPPGPAYCESYKIRYRKVFEPYSPWYNARSSFSIQATEPGRYLFAIEALCFEEEDGDEDSIYRTYVSVETLALGGN